MNILITTSRRPTKRIRTLCRDLVRSIPNAFRANRGKSSLDGVAEKAFESKADRIIVVSRRKGVTGKIELYQIGSENDLIRVPPILYVAGVKLQREFNVRLQPLRSLTVTTSSEASQQDMKLARSLSDFLRTPLSSREGDTSNYQVSIQVSSNPLHLIQVTFFRLPQADEIGPRIVIKRVAWVI